MFESLEDRQCMSATLLTVATVQPAPVVSTSTTTLTASLGSPTFQARDDGGCIPRPPIIFFPKPPPPPKL